MENNTHDKIYSILLEMKQDFGSVKADVQNLAKTMGEVKEQTTKTNGRVSLLEQFNLSLKTKVGIFASVFGVVGGIFIAIIKDKILKLF